MKKWNTWHIWNTSYYPRFREKLKISKIVEAGIKWCSTCSTCSTYSHTYLYWLNGIVSYGHFLYRTFKRRYERIRNIRIGGYDDAS